MIDWKCGYCGADAVAVGDIPICYDCSLKRFTAKLGEFNAKLGELIKPAESEEDRIWKAVQDVARGI